MKLCQSSRKIDSHRFYHGFPRIFSLPGAWTFKKTFKKTKNRRVFTKGGIEQTPFPLPSQLKAVAESGPGQAWLELLKASPMAYIRTSLVKPTLNTPLIPRWFHGGLVSWQTDFRAD
jgi:hypothetical protein